MVGESVAFLRAEGQRVFFDAEHFFDGYKANPEFALRVLERPQQGRGAGAVRHQRRLAAARGPAHRGRGRGLLRSRPADRHPHPERHRLRGGQLGGRGGGRRHPRPGDGQRLRRAHRQRQPDDGRPRPPAQDGRDLPARGPHRAPDRGERHRRVGQPAASRRCADPYVGASAFAHKGGLHLGAGPGGGASYEHVDPTVVGTTPGCWCGPRGRSMSLKAQEFGVDLDDRSAGDLSERLKRWRPRATSSRRPTPPWSC